LTRSSWGTNAHEEHPQEIQTAKDVHTAYKDPDLPASVRALDRQARLTLEEKAGAAFSLRNECP
jgi:hypothetical protein